jgi:hypothetical protein
MTGCTKDEDKDPEVGTKLTEIVPQDFLNEALKMGFTLHTGDNPPAIVGDYLLAPWRLDADNRYVPGLGIAPGHVYENGFTLSALYEQSGSALSVEFTGFYQGEADLTKPFVIGSGNNFTICRHRRMVGGMGAFFSFPYAILISGTKDGNTLKNVQMASIGLKADVPNEANVAVEGDIKLYSDVDGISTMK